MRHLAVIVNVDTYEGSGGGDTLRLGRMIQRLV